MPLMQVYEAPSGEACAAALHVITEVLVEVLAQRMRATVATYRSAEAFLAGKAPIDTRGFTWGVSDFAENVGTGVMAGVGELQAALLERPEFAGAQIVDDAGQPPTVAAARVAPDRTIPAPAPGDAPSGVLVVLAPPVDDEPAPDDAPPPADPALREGAR